MSNHNTGFYEEMAKIIFQLSSNEPRCEKNGLRGFLLGPPQTRLYSYIRWLEA